MGALHPAVTQTNTILLYSKSRKIAIHISNFLNILICIFPGPVFRRPRGLFPWFDPSIPQPASTKPSISGAKNGHFRFFSLTVFFPRKTGGRSAYKQRETKTQKPPVLSAGRRASPARCGEERPPYAQPMRPRPSMGQTRRSSRPTTMSSPMQPTAVLRLSMLVARWSPMRKHLPSGTW